MKKLILLLALLPAIIFAESNPSFDSQILDSVYTPLASIYGAPETNVYGVNVINGDYNYSTVDFNLPGADPLVL
jgi:hypothetical protein